MLPDVIWQLLTSSIHLQAIPGLERRRIVVTGSGASEGPARFLASLLRHRVELRAAFVPVSAFVEPVSSSDDDVLIVFSQGISPNARLALRQAGSFGAVVLFTGIYPEGRSLEARLVSDLRRAGVSVHVLPPEDESGLMLRILGPSAATLAAMLFVKEAADALGRPFAEREALSTVPDHLATARTRVVQATEVLEGDWPSKPWALVTAGGYGELCEGLRWKWMTGLLAAAPPLWDVLQIPHGPLQHFYNEPMTLVALERRNDDRDGRLFDRLEAMLVPGRHRLVRLRSVFDGPLAVLDHDAQCNWLLLRVLEGRSLDLATWPGKGLDGPLYELGRDFT